MTTYTIVIHTITITINLVYCRCLMGEPLPTELCINPMKLTSTIILEIAKKVFTLQWKTPENHHRSRS